MNPKARITYRFDAGKQGGAGGGGGRLVRVLPEGGRSADAGREDRQSAADSVWPEELVFETDVIPWKSPFQDDTDALERLIRETDGQTIGTGRGPAPDSARGTHIRPVPERTAEPEETELQLPVPAAVGDARMDARMDGRSADAESGLPPADRELHADAEDRLPSGYIVPRRRPPAPSWTRAIAAVAGAVLTGALFGYLVMSLLFWQTGTTSEEAGAGPDGKTDIVLPEAGTPVSNPDQAGESPDASGSLAAVDLPAVRYYVLQYGVFSTEAGLGEALAQLRAAGHAAAADTADGYRAYAGIAESREAAEALAAALDDVELYIRPLDIPAADRLAYEGKPNDAEAFIHRTNDLIRTMGGLSASLLAAGGTNPVPDESWSDWETAFRRWSEAAGAAAEGASARSGMAGIAEPLGKAAESFAAYRGKPDPAHLWAVQSRLIEAAVAQRDWMRASGAL